MKLKNVHAHGYRHSLHVGFTVWGFTTPAVPMLQVSDDQLFALSTI